MIIKNVNVSKLHTELNNAGIFPNPVFDLGNNEGDFTFTDEDMALVQQIIDAHEPTPMKPIPSKEEILERELANTNALLLELTELILGGM